MREGPPYWSNMEFDERWFKINPEVKVYRMHLMPGKRGDDVTEDKTYSVISTQYHSSNNSNFVIVIKNDHGAERTYDPGYFKFADDRINDLIEILFT